MRYGTAVCNGVFLEVIDIKLRDSKVFMVLRTQKRGDYLVKGPVTVFGEDGKGLFQGGNVQEATTQNGYLTIYLPVHIYYVDP